MCSKDETQDYYVDYTCNEQALRASELCGCLDCLEIFPPSEITWWVTERYGPLGGKDNHRTAFCPRCQVDMVVPPIRGKKLTPDQIEEYIKKRKQQYDAISID